MNWISFWDSSPPIYVSPRHKAVHYNTIATQIAGHLGERRPRVLDFGCGEALSADLVAARSQRLVLCDAAISVRQSLAERTATNPVIGVCAPEDLAGFPDGSFDVIVINSVVQYLKLPDLQQNLTEWKRLLAPGGEMLFADIIPPDLGPLADASQLLALARRHGFLADALIGLVRTALSDYRKLRAELGLTMLRENEFIELMGQHGLVARRLHPNLGHNQGRMAFLVSPDGGLTSPSRTPGSQ